MKEDIKKFIGDQLSVWPMASLNFRSLKKAGIRKFELDGINVVAQYNPCRITSSTAEVDEDSISKRACFLCPQNRPKEQFHLKFSGRKTRRYNIQVNPFPIFPDHLVIARDEHIPQAIWHHLPDMLDFAMTYPEWTVFYNGPQSGASAPDHLHFQAAPRSKMPLEVAVDAFLDNPGNAVATLKDASLYLYPRYANGIFALKATTTKSLAKLFYRLLECCDKRPGDTEPRFNLYAWFCGSEWRVMVIFRSEIRSHHYYSEGSDHLTMSPGAADMAGFFVCPREEDFLKLDSRLLREMVDEVTISRDAQDTVLWRLTRTQARIEVGILSGKEIVFEIISDGAGPQRVSFADGRINYNGTLYDELQFDAITRSTRFAEASFILYDNGSPKQYAGSLKFIVGGENVTAVNKIGLEDYVLSVLSPLSGTGMTEQELRAEAIRVRSSAHDGQYPGIPRPAGEDIRDAVDKSWGLTSEDNVES